MVNFMDKHLKRIRIRRGLNRQRKEVVFEDGEPVFTTDTQRVFIGDNKSQGGICQTRKNKFITDLNNEPDTFERGELAYNTTDNETYIATNNTGVNNLVSITIGSSTGSYNDILNNLSYIDDIIINVKTNCCDPILMTDDDLNILTDSDELILA
jgi:hypothetical protein